MSFSVSIHRRTLALALGLASGGPAVAAAQGVAAPSADTGADSVLRARSPAGSTRVSLSGTTLRLDGGLLSSFGVSAGAIPFVSDHVQLGLAPDYTLFTGAQSTTYRAYGMAATANYVFGGGARWRGYAGGFGSSDGATGSAAQGTVGAQAGALFFLDPAVALRGELRYRRPTSGPVDGRGSVIALATLDPYLFGRASDVAPWAAGWGTVDVAGTVYAARDAYYSERGISGSVAPYLTRWAQVGVEGEAVHLSDVQGFGSHRLRGFARGYVPLTVRTQPFVQGFAESSTYGSDAGGLSRYGGALGVRQMLNARVGLDVGVQRTLYRRQQLGDGLSYRPPGETGLVLGLVTRLGRSR